MSPPATLGPPQHVPDPAGIRKVGLVRAVGPTERIGFTPLTEARESLGGYDGPASYLATLRNMDNDGFIGQDEYLTLFAIVVPGRQAALAGFQQLDTDGGGRISVAEFEAGVWAVMLSNDPATPGTAILGQAP